jgi:WD40 repeat protein
MAVVAAAVFGGLWRRSEQEGLRAEAAKLVALGQTQLDDYPTSSVAYATASLELADTLEARVLALEALWRGPPARILPITIEQGYYRHAFSPDGRRLAATGTQGKALLYAWDGGSPIVLPHPFMGGPQEVFFSPDGMTVITDYEKARVWSVPEGELISTVDRGGNSGRTAFSGDRLITTALRSDAGRWSIELRSCSPDGNDQQSLGSVSVDRGWVNGVDPSGKWFAYVRHGTVRLRSFKGLAEKGEQILAPLGQDIVAVSFSASGRHLALTSASGVVEVWPTPGNQGTPVLVSELENHEGMFDPRVDRTGLLVAQGSSADRAAFLWHLDGPPDADHTVLRRADVTYVWDAAFDSDSRWLATIHDSSISFWPLLIPRARVIRKASAAGGGWLRSTADGQWLASCVMADGVRLWPLKPGMENGWELRGNCWTIAFHPSRHQLAFGRLNGPIELLSIESGEATTLIEKVVGVPTGAGFDGKGQRFAVGTAWAKDPNDMIIRVVDLDTGRVRQISQLAGTVVDETEWDPYTLGVLQTEFAPDGTLYSAGRGGIRRWDLGSSTAEFFVEAEIAKMDLSSDGRHLLSTSGEVDVYHVAQSELRVFDLVNDSSLVITTHGRSVNAVAFDLSAQAIVTGDGNGVVRVGPINGEEPHLFLGHKGRVTGAVVSPDGRWVFTMAGDEIRQWPMPDLDKPPLHTLPHDELIAKLKTLTNLRVVRDEESSTGWKVDVGPFPGWATVPEW